MARTRSRWSLKVERSDGAAAPPQGDGRRSWFAALDEPSSSDLEVREAVRADDLQRAPNRRGRIRQDDTAPASELAADREERPYARTVDEPQVRCVEGDVDALLDRWPHHLDQAIRAGDVEVT